MKVAELEGAQLDYWVAKAEGYEHGLRIKPAGQGPVSSYPATCFAPAMPDSEQLQGISSGTSDIYSPSTEWSQGGPIIERERIAMFPAGELGWAAFIQGPNCHYVDTTAYDEMRCVAPRR
jgi:hypothetical protein